MTTRHAAIGFIVALLFLGVVGVVTPAGLELALTAGLVLAVPSLALCIRLDRRAPIGLPAIFLTAITLRWLVATVVQLIIYEHTPAVFAPDEVLYDWAGQLYAMYMKGDGPDPYGGAWPRGIVLISSTSYYLFGVYPLIPKLVIGVIGGWTAVFTALIAQRFVPAAIARRAGFLAAVFPSLVLWSSLLIKDTSTLCSGQLALLTFLHLRERFRLTTLMLFIFALAWIASDRPYEVIFVALAVLASFLVASDRRLLRNGLLFLVTSAVLLFIINRSDAGAVALGSGDTTFMDRLASLRTGYSTGVGSAVNTELIDTSSVGGLVAWLPIGLAYFFLAPFPFTGSSSISLATSPEMLLIYFLIPSIWRGLREQLSRRAKPFMTIFFYCGISAVGWSMVITNVGSIYRYRSQVFFVPLILIAADQIVRRERRAAASARMHDQALLRDASFRRPASSS